MPFLYNTDVIYRDALFTIAAETALSANEGFLAARTAHTSTKIPIRCKDGTFGTMSLYQGQSSFTVRIEEPSPLEDRAWTLPKRMLSSRVVTFASTTVNWCCRGGQYNMGGCFCPKKNGVFFDLRKERLCDKWHEIVFQYSRRKHTVLLDRLRALSGIAKVEATRRSARYLAGLFEDNLLYYLLWKHWSRISPPPDCQAPSWSGHPWRVRSRHVSILRAELAQSLTVMYDSSTQIHLLRPCLIDA
jgi:hypothetical protein